MIERLADYFDANPTVRIALRSEASSEDSEEGNVGKGWKLAA